MVKFNQLVEFLAACIWKEAYDCNEKLREGFQIFDKDGNGMIDSNEMREVVGKKLDSKYSEFWDNLLKEVDINGDGKIDFFEFKKLLYPPN